MNDTKANKLQRGQSVEARIMGPFVRKVIVVFCVSRDTVHKIMNAYRETGRTASDKQLRG